MLYSNLVKTILILLCTFLSTSTTLIAQDDTKSEIKPWYTQRSGYTPKEEFKEIKPAGVTYRFNPGIDQEYFFRGSGMNEAEREARILEFYGEEAKSQLLDKVSFWLLPLLTLSLLAIILTPKPSHKTNTSLEQIVSKNRTVPAFALGLLALFLVFGLYEGNTEDFLLLTEYSWYIVLGLIAGFCLISYLFSYMVSSVGIIQQAQRIVLLVGSAFGMVFLAKYINDLNKIDIGSFFQFEGHLLNWISTGITILLSAFILLQKQHSKALTVEPISANAS